MNKLDKVLNAKVSFNKAALALLAVGMTASGLMMAGTAVAEATQPAVSTTAPLSK